MESHHSNCKFYESWDHDFGVGLTVDKVGLFEPTVPGLIVANCKY
jgi:hypothetical protein